MITYNEIIEMARHIARRSRGLPDRRIMHPVRDWLIGFSVATLIFACLSIYAGWIFFTEKNTDIDAYAVRVETITYEHERVREVLDTYRMKEQQFNALRTYRSEPLPESNELPEDTSLSPVF